MNKKHLIFVAALILAAVACDKNTIVPDTGPVTPEEEDPTPVTVSYSDMKILTITYDEIPISGSSVTPTLAYSYKANYSDGKTEEMKKDADVSFTPDETTEGFSVDATTGAVKAPINVTVDKKSYKVKLHIAKETAACDSVITVYQTAAPEEIISTVMMQAPIRLAEHTCVYPVRDTLSQEWLFDKKVEHSFTTTRNDGKAERDYFDQIDPNCGAVNLHDIIGIEPEYVSTRGVAISVSGGELLAVNTYRSGKKDTSIVQRPVFSTSTDYVFWKEQYLAKNGYQYTEDKPENAPKCSYNDGRWTINQIGAGQYKDISHTLTATAGDSVTCLTINQQNNYTVNKKDEYIIWNSHNAYTQRDDWPNYSDYPPGSKPKWPKYEDGSYKSTLDAKDLHPDNNRCIDFYLNLDYDRYGTRNIYLSEAVQEPFIFEHRNGTYFLRGGIKITATATARLKDGSTKDERHIYEWIQPSKICSINYGCFSVIVPIIENIAEDFEWTFKMEMALTDESWVDFCRMNTEGSNYYTYDWIIPDFTFTDHISTKQDWSESVRFSGFCNRSEQEMKTADIIDGVKQ